MPVRVRQHLSLLHAFVPADSAAVVCSVVLSHREADTGTLGYKDKEPHSSANFSAVKATLKATLVPTFTATIETTNAATHASADEVREG